MKTKILFTIVLILCVWAKNSSLFAQSSGTISLHEAYADNMGEDWGIETGVNKPVKITYHVDVEDDCDYVTIYDVDNSGNRTALITLSGSRSGTIFTTSRNGKAEIGFTSDGSVSYQDGYTGFDIQFTVDDRFEVNGLNVTGDSYVSGNSFAAGNAYISGLAAIGTIPFLGNKFNVYNSTENVALRASTSKTTTSSAYGIYSSGYNYSSGTTYGLYSTAYSTSGSVYGLYSTAYSTSGSVYGLYSAVTSGSSSKKWAGYFTGGTFEINDGKLHLNGNTATTQTTNAGMITFWDDARFTVTNSTIPSLRTSSYLMTNYGVAAVPVTGGADLWLSGYSGIRMFTGAVAVPRFNITNDGNVGIGTTNPQYKLDVKGQIRATEVLVQSVDQFADFVFDKDYRLPSLHEINAFIQDNGHLPGIPSAQEVKENGMSLVEMQVKLLQKVEELTLYSIKQQEEIKALKDELDKLKKK